MTLESSDRARHTTVDSDVLACNVGGTLRRQEGDGRGDFFGLAVAPQRHACAAFFSPRQAILALRRKTGRNQDSERTAFIFRGYGLADLAIAGLALREAEKTNLGLVIDSEE